MKIVNEAVDAFHRGALESTEFLEIIRTVGLAAAEPLLAAIFVDGEPHNGARVSPKWTIYQHETLFWALGLTKNPVAIQWLEFAIHSAGGIEFEGTAALALQEIGTDEAMEALVDGVLYSTAIGDSAETLYDVIVANTARTLPILEVIVGQNVAGERHDSNLYSVLETCAEMGGDDWVRAHALIEML